MGDTLFISDTINTVCRTVGCVETVQEKSLLDIICSLANIAIALANIFLIYFIFDNSKKNNNTDKEKERKLSLLKTLVLDYNMPDLYSFFKDINSSSEGLKQNNLSDDAKAKINDVFKDRALQFRQGFIDLFLAIDNSLYDKILVKTDEMIDTITETIFDCGVNLSHQPKFEELISNKISKSKTEIIKILFSYKGE